MAIAQARRLSYTRRDVQSYHDDVSKFIREFIPRITESSEATEGRLYLTAFEALIDNANYAVDQTALEAKPTTAEQRKNLLAHAYSVDYKPIGVSAATVDATVSMISGVAPPGGQSIPIYSRFQTKTSPILEFLAASTVSIPEGETSTVIPLIQGQRTVDYTLTASASGLPNQVYKLPVPNTPDAYIDVKVNSVVWTRPERNDLYNSMPEDQHFFTVIDADNYVSICFGDGVPGDDQTHGLIPPAGAIIQVSYITCALAEGNVPAGAISVVVGSLANTVSITNSVAASGGADAESIKSIKRNIPAHHAAFERAVNDEDYQYFAERVPGVYKAYAKHVDGPRTDVYIMPDGGGVASSLLLSTVQSELIARGFEGAVVYTYALSPAYVTIAANMVLKTSRVQKSIAKGKARAALLTALDYTNISPGVGWKLSDVNGIFESLDNGNLVDYVDLVMMSRVPRVIQSNTSAPSIQGRVQLADGVGYSTYLIQAITTTTFLVSINGTPESVAGTVGTAYSTSDGYITFTLGLPTDTLTVGDTWTIKTSKYRESIYLDPDEFMALQLDSDLSIAVYYPNEYNFVKRSSV